MMIITRSTQVQIWADHASQCWHSVLLLNHYRRYLPSTLDPEHLRFLSCRMSYSASFSSTKISVSTSSPSRGPDSGVFASYIVTKVCPTRNSWQGSSDSVSVLVQSESSSCSRFGFIARRKFHSLVGQLDKLRE